MLKYKLYKHKETEELYIFWNKKDNHFFSRLGFPLKDILSSKSHCTKNSILFHSYWFVGDNFYLFYKFFKPVYDKELLKRSIESMNQYKVDIRTKML